MPEMPVCDAEGKLIEGGILEVWAYMVHPLDSDARTKMLAAYIYGADLEAQEKDEPSGGLLTDRVRLEFLIDVPELAKLESRALLRAAPVGSGSIVGEMLLALLNAKSEYRYLGANLNDVVEIFAKLYDGAINGDGEQLNSGTALMWRLWTQLKPAAHLWASIACRSEVEELPDGLLEGSEGAMRFVADHTIEFLTLAELLRVEAESLEIFEPGETWRLPGNFRQAEIDPMLPGFAPELLKRFEDHRGRHWPGPDGEFEAEMNSETTYLELADARGESLPLLHEKELTPFCPGIIQAWMLYPMDEEGRHEYFNSWYLSVVLEDSNSADFVAELSRDGGHEKVAELMRQSLETASFHEVAGKAIPRIEKGICSAIILNYWLKLRAADPDSRPTPTAVISTYAKYLASLEKSGAPVGPHSERWLTDTWREFRPVSHLYSTLLALYPDDAAKGRNTSEGEEQETWLFNRLDIFAHDEILQFFNLAEGIRHFVSGVNRKLGAKMVAVPESAGVAPIPVEHRQELPEEFLELYRQYRPKHSAT